MANVVNECGDIVIKFSAGAAAICSPEESAIPAAVSLLPLATNHASDVLDMPVDPNEPTYCLCHQVSYGEMIGCDNQDVCVFSYLFIPFISRVRTIV